MIQVEVIYRHNDVVPELLRNKNVVIIDVFRATSVLVTALYHGAKSVTAVAEIEEAFQIKKKYPEVLLAGERDALKIDGFDFGNSPIEMISSSVKDKHLVMCTSNGSKAVRASRFAKTIRTTAFINMSAVADDLIRQAEDFIIVCSGTNGHFSLDDGLAAGMLVNKLRERVDIHVSDSGLAMSLAAKTHPQLKDALQECYHLNILQQRGFQKDIDYCLKADTIQAVPKYMDGKFIL